MTSSSARETHLAGFISRFIALAMDLVIITLLISVVGFTLQTIGQYFHVDKLIQIWFGRLAIYPALIQQRPVLTGVVSYVFAILYFAFFWSLTGSSPGKYVMGLRVVRLDGQRIGFGRASLRALAYILSAIPLFLGFLWVIVDRRRQGFHDKVVRTVVEYRSMDRGS